MNDKVYRPVLKDNEHLVNSKDNPERVRGLSRDANNQNPDIPEWEEVDLDELKSDTDIIDLYEENRVELTPEQQAVVEIISNLLVEVVIGLGRVAYRDFFKPLLQQHVRPWIRAKGKALFQRKSKNHTEEIVEEMPEVSTTVVFDPKFEDVSTQIDQVFEQMYFDMDADEAANHMMRLIYHMLGVVNEIRILSDARIRKERDSDAEYLKGVSESERFLGEKVASCLDRLLDDPSLKLDLETSRELFSLTGGGVRIYGEYAPVQPKRIEEVLREISLHSTAS